MVKMNRFLAFGFGSALWLLTAYAIAVAQEPQGGGAANQETSAVQGLQHFATPEKAAHAFVAALAKGDEEALLDVLGHDYADDLFGPDLVSDKALIHRAYLRSKEKLVIHRDSEDRVTLLFGKNAWPMPIPLVRDGDSWVFDTAAGAEVILERRIGDGELSAIATMEAFVKAQRDYANRLREAGKPVHYARYVQSTAGKTDGLWWDKAMAKVAGPSPLDEFVEKQKEFLHGRQPGDPFKGYYFRILTGQGPHTKGGAKSYFVNGAMIGGFAMVAWPAEYRDSGVMTFMVNQDGRVMEKDLGEETASLVETLRVYDPDDSWQAAE